jgi:hypothetical protein
VFEDSAGARQTVDLELLGVLFNKAAQFFLHNMELRTPQRVRVSSKLKCISHDANIRVAMRMHSVEIKCASRCSAEHPAKPEVVNRITAVKQSSVYVKEVSGVSIPPSL